MLHPSLLAPLSLALAPAALAAGPAAPRTMDTRVVESHDGAAACAKSHRSALNADGDVIVRDDRDLPARALREALEGVDFVRAGAGAARGAGLDVQYLLEPAVAADPDFVAGLEEAASVWENLINDDVAIFIEVGFVSDQGFIGAASNNSDEYDYNLVRSAMLSDAGPEEAAYCASLPSPLTIESDGGFSDSDEASFDGIVLSTANARALGFAVNTNAPDFSDASIVLNTDFDFDTDPSDGIDDGATDLVYVMIHEIGHMLGFVSVTDNFFGAGDSATGLDVYRVGFGGADNDPDSLSQFSAVAREVRMGVEAALDPVNAVVGAPEAEVYRFSTGSFFGDGRQASHWKDDDLLGIQPNIGIMDPTTSAPGGPGTGTNPGYITVADRIAFSVIGWDIAITPAPGCAGDLDGTGAVGSGDLGVLLAAWGSAGTGADLDGSGTVGSGDLGILLAAWGPCPK